jgi:translation elongation factor EF-4
MDRCPYLRKPSSRPSEWERSKLLDKQNDACRSVRGTDRSRHGKKRMREYGSVSIPQEAFIAALRMGEE